MATVSRKTGFDCEFVEKPPKAVQSECPVCLQILRKPYQAPCCGNSFCCVCIERIKTDNKPCPTCKEENFVTFHNKGLQRSLYGSKVYCSHKQKGCEWKGELGQLDNHLILSPQPDKQLVGCKYSEIECIYCSELIERCNITAHQNDLCPKRPFSCEYCHSYVSSHEDVIHNHWPVCGYHPIQCPNECGMFPQRQGLENHVTIECPMITAINCDFHHVGCDVRLPRKDMPSHLKENLVTHVSLQTASHNVLLERYKLLLPMLDRHSELLTKFQSRIAKLESENKALNGEIQVIQQENKQTVSRMQEEIDMLKTEAKKSQQTKVSSCFVEFTMDNFEQQKQNDECWFSPPFYTNSPGYKFSLKVFPNGTGKAKGTHVSVSLHLMSGKFDDLLKWPFRGQFNVQLVDQKGGREHFTAIINFDDQTPDVYAGRVTEGERNAKGWGKALFMPHDNLHPMYLRADSIRFRISSVEFKVL